MSRLIDYQEISVMTGVPVNTLYVWRARGKMPPVARDNDGRHGSQPLWEQSEIEEAIDAGELPRPD